MSTDVVYTAVRTFLEAQWTQTGLAWENEAFTPQTDANGNPLPYVSVEIAGNIYHQMSIGTGAPSNDLWREEGHVWLHVFVPTGSGSLTGRQLATALVDLFRGTTLDPAIEFRDISVGLGQPSSEDGAWWELSCSIEWIRN